MPSVTSAEANIIDPTPSSDTLRDIANLSIQSRNIVGRRTPLRCSARVFNSVLQIRMLFGRAASRISLKHAPTNSLTFLAVYCGAYAVAAAIAAWHAGLAAHAVATVVSPTHASSTAGRVYR